jgi:hypothetical protein
MLHLQIQSNRNYLLSARSLRKPESFSHADHTRPGQGVNLFGGVEDRRGGNWSAHGCGTPVLEHVSGVDKYGSGSARTCLHTNGRDADAAKSNCNPDNLTMDGRRRRAFVMCGAAGGVARVGLQVIWAGAGWRGLIGCWRPWSPPC